MDLELVEGWVVSIRLIINSDDYGRSAEVSRGIRQAHLHGVVTSTTCMMNLPTTDEDIHRAREEAPQLGLGVHLVLTCGKPLLPPERVSTLINENGEFLDEPGFVERLNMGNINFEQAKAEWRLQIEKFIAAAGRNPTHLDSHHHTSFYSAGLFRGMLELAHEHRCAIRLPRYISSGAGEPTYSPESSYLAELVAEFKPRHADAFIDSFYAETATLEQFTKIIELECFLPATVGEGTYEIMCHPGYVDEYLISSSAYSQRRADELGILTDPVIMELIHSRQIELITFDQL